MQNPTVLTPARTLLIGLRLQPSHSKHSETSSSAPY